VYTEQNRPANWPFPVPGQIRANAQQIRAAELRAKREKARAQYGQALRDLGEAPL
jgi:hypothetical protein